MGTIKIKDDICAVGAQNPTLRIFDVVMCTEYGTTYNAYLLRGSAKTALVETCHASFFDVYLENIRELCAPSDIDYIILNHCEPDHSGSLRRLLELCPRATVICSQAGALYLQHITNLTDLRIQTVKEGDTLDLGGRTLRFLIAPFLHWPDSMFTWSEADGALFSCDFLGAHYCEPYGLDTKTVYPEKYKQALQSYYDAIFGPFPSYVRKGLEKLEGLDIQFACTSHGPVLTKGCLLEYALDRYRDWSQPAAPEKKKIPIFYCSAYGNTGLLAAAIQDVLLSRLPAAAVPLYDINEHDMGFLRGELNASDAFALGSPTFNADAVPPVWELLTHVDAVNCRKKPALVFGSYGWSGEALPNLSARLKGLKMAVYEPEVRARFVPSEAELAAAKEAALDFAKGI